VSKNPSDRHVLAKLVSQRVLENKAVDDATFLRRLMLDLTGALPTPEEIKQFVDDKSAEKRQKLVDQLLAGEKYNQDYATYVSNILLAQQAFARPDTLNPNTLTAAMDQPAERLLSDILTSSVAAAKRPYSAEQLIGPPDAAMGSSSQSAWCPLTADGREEWLELDYAQPVHAVAVLVYENASAGAVTQVQVQSADQPGLSFTWADRDPTAKTVTHGVSVIPLATPMKSKRIKITLDSKNTPGWNEIDARRLARPSRKGALGGIGQGQQHPRRRASDHGRDFVPRHDKGRSGHRDTLADCRPSGPTGRCLVCAVGSAVEATVFRQASHRLAQRTAGSDERKRVVAPRR
jgi:hypothetical protein